MAPRETESEVTRAFIEVLTPEGEMKTPRDIVPVTFNPTEYQMRKGARYGEQNRPNSATPVTQFGGGDAETLSMELLFDTYEAGGDVRERYTDRLDGLLLVEENRGSPPVCRVVWGSLDFRCVLQNVDKRFTMFRPDGVPVRARVNATFKQFNPPTEEREASEGTVPDNTVVHTVQEGETLNDVARQYYGDPAEWRPIAGENGIANPRTLPAGTSLTVPPLEEEP